MKHRYYIELETYHPVALEAILTAICTHLRLTDCERAVATKVGPDLFDQNGSLLTGERIEGPVWVIGRKIVAPRDT